MKKRIILLVISIIILGALSIASVTGIHFFMNKGYSTPEELLWTNPKISCKEIYCLVENNDRVLAVYEDRTTISRAILYKENDYYYLYKYNTTPLVYEIIKTGSVFVRDVNGKITVEVSGIIGSNSITSVSDSLNSEFQYTTTKLPDGNQQQWFLAIDELPKDYCIYVDNIEIRVPQT